MFRSVFTCLSMFVNYTCEDWYLLSSSVFAWLTIEPNSNMVVLLQFGLLITLLARLNCFNYGSYILKEKKSNNSMKLVGQYCVNFKITRFKLVKQESTSVTSPIVGWIEDDKALSIKVGDGYHLNQLCHCFKRHHRGAAMSWSVRCPYQRLQIKLAYRSNFF